jgi:glucokinase
VRSAQTLDWRETDVAGAFEPLGPAVVESDVRAAALAEARFGAGRGVEQLLFVIVGTGISCCLVLGGRAYAGAHGNAICFGAPPLEEAASGLALAAAGGRERAEEVLADAALESVVQATAAELGVGLAWLVNALDPGAVVIGGGLGLVDRYRELAVEVMRPLVFGDNTRDVPVLPAELGPDAGLIGAALVAVAD